MEAVPRLHMLWFALKSSPAGTSFANLKKYIAEFYQEDPESYSKEVFALETLRNQAMHPTKDGCSIMKRYYCQLHSLQNRFPQLTDRNIFTFTWKDLYQTQTTEVTEMRYELAAVLFNIAASHTQVGASVTRGDVDGMKLACTHFQCAAWAFGELRERYSDVNAGGDFMTTELLVFMQQVSFAQAQECILEKSLIDNRKPNIVAKVTAQIVVYYGAALAALLTGGDDGPVSQVVESSVFKLWKKYVRFKISYLHCILYLYQGQHSEEQQKMGERVTLYQAAWEKLEEARKESKGLPDQKEIIESLTFTADVVEGKRKNAKNENEFIYHEAVPELSSISAVQGANLVNGISFSVTDPEVAGEDIFARLVPMKAHEASSMYSEEKAKLLRKYGGLIEEKDTELTSFMSSLTLDNLNINEEKANKIPQGIVDRCAALNANKAAIPDLITSMSQLADICTDVELNLKEIGAILAAEEHEEKDFQQLTGMKRTPNAHITELTREYQKYLEAHSRAGESNDTLRKAMELHVNNLKILARPLQEIQQSVPKLSSELNTNDIFKDVKLIVNKVNEMKAQRSQFHADLRIAVNNDDITTKVIAHNSEEGLQLLFDRELAKHERLSQLIDQNLLAQKNILQALTESYAKAAPILKTLADVKHKRESFFSSLAASYDVYEDLLAKSAKGLEFYRKLSGNVSKLLTRLKSARDVQAEERQQRLKSVPNPLAKIPPSAGMLPKDNLPTAASVAAAVGNATQHTLTLTSTPTLRDYLKAKNTSAANIAAGGGGIGGTITPPSSTVHSNVNNNTNISIPSIRPNPLGSETPSQAICSGAHYAGGNVPINPNMNTSMAPNEPPPPYSLQQTQYFDPIAAGYTNPIYQQQQQNMAPPAYKPQASPNSQFTQNFGNMSLNGGGAGAGFGAATFMAPNMNSNTSNYILATSGNFQQQQHQAHPNAIYGNNQTQTPPQQIYSSAPQHLNLQYPLMHDQQYVASSTSASTQPLYVSTTSNEATNTNVAQPTPPLSQQPSFIVNPMQAQQQHQQQQPQLQQTMQRIRAQQPQVSLQQHNMISIQQQPQQHTIPHQQPQQQTIPQQQPIPQMPQQQAVTLQQPTLPITMQMQHTVAQQQQQQTHQQQQQQKSIIGQQQPTMHPQQSLSMQTQQPTQVSNQMQQQQQPNQQLDLKHNPPMQTSIATTGTVTGFNGSTTNTPGGIKHPGYSFNPQTGQYEYGSGYQQATAELNKQFYGQYTSATAMQHGQIVGTTDSAQAYKSNFATGFDSPIVSHIKTTATTKGAGDGNASLSYYTPPYGYQSHSAGSGSVQQGTALPTTASVATTPIAIPLTPQQQQQQQQQQQHQQQQQQHLTQLQQMQPQNSPTICPQQSTYMQSGGASIANTQTTKSAAEYASSPTAYPTAIVNTTMKPAQEPTKKLSNIDLLTDIDISEMGVSGVPPPILPEPVLKPVVVPSPPASHVSTAASPKKNSEPIQTQVHDSTKEMTTLSISTASVANTAVQQTAPISQNSPIIMKSTEEHENIAATSESSIAIAPTLRKESYDNLSICSDLSSLDNFDFDSVSTTAATATIAHNGTPTAFLMTPHDPFTDDKTLKYFHKEVERFEKTVESLNVKMLNGHTQLSAKWKELHDLLAKDASKRTTTIAKLFPEKNRSLDCLPYDHARVKLEKNTDDYINAAYIKNLGAGCPYLIIAQTPQQNTVNDFWSMIWSQKARTVICLHTPNEMLDPYWPQELNTETHFNDFSVKCNKVETLSNCVVYNLKLTLHGADPIIDLSLLQVKAWTKSSLSQIIGIASNVLHVHRQRCLEFNAPTSPLIMNCLTGSDRSELVAVAICAILATQAKRPLLINIVDVWYRICCQRQQALRDTATLEQSMQIVLTHAHDVLNKRGIMTSYQMKIAPQVASQEKEEIKDPLNELDPLWKLK